MRPRAFPFEPYPPLSYGIRNRKKLAELELTGTTVEKAPVPSVTPFVLIVQLAIGVSRLVVVNTV